MLDGRWRAKVERRLDPVGRGLHRSGISADGLTIVGLVVAIVTAVLIANGNLLLGAIGLVLTGLPDVLDGSVAALQRQGRAPGGLLRLGRRPRLRRRAARWRRLAPHVGQFRGARSRVLAVLAASMLVSYERAKAESLGFSARGGFMDALPSGWCCWASGSRSTSSSPCCG